MDWVPGTRTVASMVALAIGVTAGFPGGAVAARTRPPPGHHHHHHRRAPLRYAPAARSTVLTGVRLHRPPRRPPPTPTPPSPPPSPPVTPTPAPATSITVATGSSGATIDPALFGSDLLAPFDGMGAFDPTHDVFWSSFTSQLSSVVGAGSLRFPGGITAQSYDWERAIGPQAQRTPNPVGPFGRPSPSSVGPDEFGRLLDLTGAVGVVDVDYATGTATEAADFVHYMTDPAGSSPWAQRRATDGHPAPYDVPWWEVGNEETAPDYWRSGTPVSVGTPPPGANPCPDVATCEYIYGGTTAFTNQQVVLPADRSPTATLSTGAAGQSFEVEYPPVSGAPTIAVNGTAWTEVSTLSGVGPGAQDYTLSPTTGTITFGDGANGAIPPSGARISATYHSGPHDGFLAYETAMTQANPAIHVCSADPSPAFIAAMGSTEPYGCLQDHPYVGAGSISPSLDLGTYESQVMTVPDGQAAAVASLQAAAAAAAGHPVAIVLTEYGQLISATPDPLQAPYYLDSLDEAVLNATQLADWIGLGIPVADRQLLAAELPSPSAVTAGLPGAAPYATTGAITTPGPQTVVQPTGEFLGLMEPLAGGALLPSSVAGNPALSGSDGDLATVSAATSAGVRLVVINRSPTADVPATVALAGVSGNATATVTTLDGPSPLADNTAAAPSTVTMSSRPAAITGGTATVTFPAHSVSLVTVPGL